MTKLLIALSIAVLVASCASNQANNKTPVDTEKENKVSSKNVDGYICRKVAVLGTHRKKTVCSTLAQRQQAKRDADKILREESYKQNNMTGPTGN